MCTPLSLYSNWISKQVAIFKLADIIWVLEAKNTSHCNYVCSFLQYPNAQSHRHYPSARTKRAINFPYYSPNDPHTFIVLSQFKEHPIVLNKSPFAALRERALIGILIQLPLQELFKRDVALIYNFQTPRRYPQSEHKHPICTRRKLVSPLTY